MANAHSSTMTTQEICSSLPVQDIATDDALLFLWSTFPVVCFFLDEFEFIDASWKTSGSSHLPKLWNMEAKGKIVKIKYDEGELF